MAIPAEIKAQIDMLRQAHRQLRNLSDEQLIEMIQKQAMLLQKVQGAALGAADMEKMSAQECGAIGQQLLQLGRWQEAERWFLAALEKAERVDDLWWVQGMAVGALGELCARRGEFLQAMALLQQALGLAERHGDRSLQGISCSQIGDAHLFQGQYPQAIECFKKSLEIGEEIGDKRMQAATYGSLGNVYLSQGDFGRAIEAYEKSLAVSLKIGADEITAGQYSNLGNVYREQGRYDLSTEMYRKSLAITERLGDEAMSANQ
jgi:tetratricopeptide (TPR) repeat protein